MPNDSTTTIHGTLGENGDTFFIVTQGHMVLIDAPFLIDDRLMGKEVSAIGRMGIPASAPGITKLLVDRIVSHDAIAVRAYELFASGEDGSQDDHWFRAERALLEVPSADPRNAV